MRSPLPRLSIPLLIAALALTGTLPGATGDKSPRLGEAKGITFSGYENDGAGRRRWSLDADSARPAEKSANPDEKPGKRWIIETLNLRSYIADGAVQMRVRAPRALYVDEVPHSASDPGEVELTGEGINLTGKDWSWSDAGANQHIEIKNGVRVVLAPRAKDKVAAREPAVIEAKTLLAEITPTGIRLTFSGDVQVTQGNTVMKTPKVVTLVNQSHGRTGPLPVSATDKNAVERITATGGVRIENPQAILTGNEATISPGSRICQVNGNAKFQDLSDKRIRVEGDAMTYSQSTGEISVTPEALGRVRAELPAFESERAAATASDDPARASASAEKLTIRLAKSGNTLRMHGDVRIKDPLTELSCGSLQVETPPGKSSFAPADGPANRMRRILAEDTVVLTRDGRTLRCGRAEILPPENKVYLTGAPRGEDPKLNATFEADQITLDTHAKTLAAEAGTDRRVRVTLKDKNPKNETPYVVEAGLLLVSPPDGDTTPRLALKPDGRPYRFEFEDRVTLAGTDLEASSDRLGIEVASPDKAKAGTKATVRRLVAVGHVKLKQEAYAAEAGRAEILPGANLRELATKDDNGLDGKSPTYVNLDRDDDTPEVSTRVTLTHVAIPRLDGAGAGGPLAIPSVKKDQSPQPVTVEAHFHQLVAGRDRLRSFAKGEVKITSADGYFHGSCASLESRAVGNATPPDAETNHAKSRFAAEALIARGGVDVQFGDRRAKAETLEIFPIEQRISLTGSPSLDGWATPVGTARKTITWKTLLDANNLPVTRMRLDDEPLAGMPEQIIRPRLTLPVEMSEDLGRSIRKSLDNNRR